MEATMPESSSSSACAPCPSIPGQQPGQLNLAGGGWHGGGIRVRLEPTETYFKKRSKTEMFGKNQGLARVYHPPREHKHKTRFILAIQDGVPYVNKASPHDDSSTSWHCRCLIPDLRRPAPSGPGHLCAGSHARFRRDKAGPHGHVPGSVKAGNQVCRTGGKTRLHRSHPPDATGGRKFGRLAKSYPQWRPNLLQTRRQLNRENLDQWQKLAQQQAASSSSGPGLEMERPASVPAPRPKPNIASLPATGRGFLPVPENPDQNKARPLPFLPGRLRKWWRAITNASADCWIKPPWRTRLCPGSQAHPQGTGGHSGKTGHSVRRRIRLPGRTAQGQEADGG